LFRCRDRFPASRVKRCYTFLRTESGIVDAFESPQRDTSYTQAADAFLLQGQCISLVRILLFFLLFMRGMESIMRHFYC